MAQKIAVIAYITAEAGHAEAVRKTLQETVIQVRGVSGCERYELHEDSADSLRLVMVETWRDADALTAHLQSPEFQKLVAFFDGKASVEVHRLSPI